MFLWDIYKKMFSKTLPRPFWLFELCNLALFQFFQFFVGKHRAAVSNKMGNPEVQKYGMNPIFKIKSRKLEGEIRIFNDTIETSVKEWMDSGL